MAAVLRFDRTYVSPSNALSYSYQQRVTHTMQSEHCHDRVEIYYVLHGNRCVELSGKALAIEQGDLIVIKPGVLHRATRASSPYCERVSLYFSELSLLPAFLDDYAFFDLHRTRNQGAWALDLFSSLLREPGDAQGYDAFAQAVLVQILYYLGRETINSEKRRKDSPAHQKIGKVIDLLNAAYATDLDVPELARRFNISASHLSRLFKAETGYTIVDFFHEVRIREAKRLLLETDLKVSDIAERTGFGSLTHFGRVFKEITGHNPLHFRRSESGEWF